MMYNLGKWIVYGCLLLTGFARSGLSAQSTEVILYSTPGCDPCKRALRSLRELGIEPTVTRDCPSWVTQVPTIHWRDRAGVWRQHAPQHWSGKNWSELETAKLRRWLLMPSAVKSTGRDPYLTVSALADTRANGVRVAHPLFQVEGGGSSPTSALVLRFDQLSLKRAIELNRIWHSRLPKVVESNIIRTRRRICYGAEFGGLMYAVAIWTNPVARLLSPDWLELRRLAIADDAPKNTATRFIGWMVRDIKKRFPDVDRLISYQDTAVHSGTIYKASGWTPTNISEDGEWNRPNRFRVAAQSNAPKQRWELKVSRG